MGARSIRFTLVAFFVGGVIACSGGASDSEQSSDQDLDITRHHKDAGAPDASRDSGGGQDSSSGGDGTPTRQPCTNDFGSGLSGAYGRLDGYLVSIVAPGGGSCNADRHHVHLQVLAGGSIYDIAVNADGGFYMEKDAPLPGGGWSEGWHTGESLDYPGDLGVHSTDFTQATEPAVASAIESSLSQANHVSVFATPYNHSGAHLVHRRGSRQDGAVVFDPLSSTPHMLLFHFSNQSF